MRCIRSAFHLSTNSSLDRQQCYETNESESSVGAKANSVCLLTFRLVTTHELSSRTISGEKHVPLQAHKCSNSKSAHWKVACQVVNGASGATRSEKTSNGRRSVGDLCRVQSLGLEPSLNTSGASEKREGNDEPSRVIGTALNIENAGRLSRFTDIYPFHGAKSFGGTSEAMQYLQTSTVSTGGDSGARAKDDGGIDTPLPFHKGRIPCGFEVILICF
ncbi:hypothetical protein GALMADRAFT_262692 [Galerina marginata CBS 339.88]|uniref:Uncharacterized protein n=1 Tax=Galerina marginata (strain CBS 339.88) TaxID=685588 RepID=A0A067TMP1_GALM3|nr:hypothetical protein GALMADRAFT_262692 [Galerina marginata CBS 339.88]